MLVIPYTCIKPICVQLLEGIIKAIFVDRPGSNSDELIIAAVEAEEDSTETRNRDQEDYVYFDENSNQLLDSYGFPLSQVGNIVL